MIIKSLIYLHSLEIIHRDIKAENVVINIDKETNTIKNLMVIDYGFACF